jgi:hypothetical protein
LVNQSHLTHEETVELYKKTVLDVMNGDKTVIFLDTDKLLAMPQEERADAICEQVKTEHPELHQRIIELGGSEVPSENTYYQNFADQPTALTANAHLHKGLEDITTITTPSTEKDQIVEFLDKRDFITNMAIDSSQMPGSDADMIVPRQHL